MPKLSTPPINKTHTWIIVLLFWILAIAIFIAGYLITQNNAPKIVALSPTELQSQCTTAGFVDKATVDTNAAATTTNTCPTPEPVKLSYKDSFSGLTFQYYTGWQQYSFSDGPTTIYMQDGPIEDCKECSGGINADTKIRIVSTTAATATNEYSTELAALKLDSNIAITTQTNAPTGNLITWTDNSICDGVGCTTGKHEAWFLTSGKTFFNANFTDDGSTTTDNDAWNLFVSTVKVK